MLHLTIITFSNIPLRYLPDLKQANRRYKSEKPSACCAEVEMAYHIAN